MTAKVALCKISNSGYMFEEKSVLVGMSGGIDSTAVCSMLLEQGYRVEGLTFVTCDGGTKAADDAAALAARLGIPHHIADVRGEFRKQVIEPFIDAYMRYLKFYIMPPLQSKKKIIFAIH